MKIILAKSAGFCFGVKRATRMAFDAAGETCRICSLGPIIHSPQMVRQLEEKGVKVVESVEDIPDGSVIIRSHGVTADEIAGIRARGLEIVDATCPFVKKAQDYAGLLSREGYLVVIVGEKDHPEVQGIVSYAQSGEVRIVADRAEAEQLPKTPRMGIVAQTTQPLENLQEVVAACLGRAKELRLFNTICDATSVRQNEARAIAKQADLVLVIGGHNSANTNRLAQLCRDLQPRTRHVETASDLDPAWFQGVGTVGITAGASTPRWIIEEVVERVRGIGEEKKQR
jgi:4-hydroxy-3-methylbut-2-enyl diphosphate reductase